MKNIDKENKTISRLREFFKNSNSDDYVANEFFRIIDNEKFRFIELSATSKNEAAKGFWRDLDEEQQQELAWQDCLEFCYDTDGKDKFYNKNGTYYE